MRTHSLSIVITAALVVGCGASQPAAPAPAPLPSPPAPPAASSAAVAPPRVVQQTLASVGLDAAALDRSVDPCSDFYHFACGSWLKQTPIPGDESSWVRSFSEIEKRNEEDLKRILEESVAGKRTGPIAEKLGAYYGACMDEKAVEKASRRPIDPWLSKAAKVKTPGDLAALLGDLHKRQVWAMFDISPAQDFKDATKMIAYLDQNGLGLPDRDYYFRDDDSSKQLRAKYVEHVQRMLKLAGMSEARAKQGAQDVMTIETALAKVSKTNVERRDPAGLYNKIDRTGLDQRAPAFPWDKYFAALGTPSMSEINVTSIPFFEGLSELVKTTKPEALRSYLQWHIVHAAAPWLAKRFVDENFKLLSALEGQSELPPRWKRCVRATDRAMGELLAQPFIELRFGGDSKAVAESTVKAISRAFEGEVNRLDWMDAPTKERAIAKLHKMAYLIGYPNKWKTYDFPVDPKSYGANVLAARAFDTARELAKIGKPVDREEWQMSPPTVNAYYDPQLNHMVFPAGILQPPFYSVSASTAVNLGGIGMVMGHELTHGFDDEGSQFDGDGNLKSWWTPSVNELFKGKTKCVADQFDRYEPLPGLHINGKLTLGENIADLGGLKLAFLAYHALRSTSPETIVADGFTEDQQFFLAHAQAWCGNVRDEFLRTMVQTDPHSPYAFRVNGPLANLPEFGEAFHCAVGSPLRPAQTCQAW